MTNDTGRFKPHPGSDAERQRIARFYKTASVELRENGHHVLLDGRGVRTPAKRAVVLPAAELAEALAAEWQAQGEFIEPAAMPLTRLVNSAIDGIAGREAEVRADIVKYASSDLVCYEAEGPPDLVRRHSEGWGAVRAWAEKSCGLKLRLAAGIMPVEQDPEMLAQFGALIEDEPALRLGGLHAMTTLTGSAVLALACAKGRIAAADAWTLAHIDEDFQIEQWGEDTEAAKRRAARWSEMVAAARVYALSHG